MTPRIWLITGSSSGFGLHLALGAIAHGDHVIATSRSPERNQHLTEKGIKVARLNQNDPLPQIKADVEAIISIYGTVDIIVNNAAYCETGVLEEATPEATQTQFYTNVFGPLNVYRAFLPHLRSKKSGTLVTIGSVAAYYNIPSCNLYMASKAAMRSLSLGLADEVAHLGIKHTLVEPGYFRTDFLSASSNNFTGTAPRQRIPDYTELNDSTEKMFAAYDGKQPGDPVKGAEIIYDVVTGTGIAEGRKLPRILPLGRDAIERISDAARELRRVVEEWKAVSVKSDFPEGT